MRLLSTGLILSSLALFGACSQGNYAQVEPDDLYFTHKDRKEANMNYTASAAIGSTSTYNYNNEDLAKYTSQHSPTISSTTLASPTVQENEPFYDATLNPDDVATQSSTATDSASNDYYDANYAVNQAMITEEVTQVNNPAYSYGASPYYSSNFPATISLMYTFSYGFGAYNNPFNPFYDPFYNPYNNPFYSSRWNYYPGNSYYGYYDPWRTTGYGNYNNYGSGAYCYYPVTVYNNGSSYYTNNSASYIDGTKIINSPRRSRSTVSNYSGGQYVNRRSNRGNANDDSGIIVLDSKNGRQWASDVPSEKKINPYKNNGTNKSRRARYGDINSSSPTIQSSNNRRKINTTVDKQRSRTYSGANNSSSTYRTRSNYNSNSRFSTPSRSRSSSSYTPSRNSSYSPSRSSGSSGRSSYSPSRSSSPTRSPSRSSGGSRSSSRSSTTRKH